VPPPVTGSLWAAYLQLDSTQWLDPEMLETRQLAQVRTLLTHCQKHVPYYESLFAAKRITAESVRSLADFREIPLLSRRSYQEQFAHFKAGSLPEGVEAKGVDSTSGSSGVPVQILKTNVVNFWWLVFCLRDMEWCGLDPFSRLASIRYFRTAGPDARRYSEGISMPAWSPQLNLVIETGPGFLMDVHQDPRKQLNWLLKIAPNILLSFPSNLEFLANLVQDFGQQIPSLKNIHAIGETLTDEVRIRVETAFGVPVKNTYSCAEAGYIASPCPEGHGLHVHSENVLLEVLDESGQPCRPGESGRIVLTTLHNFLSPLIRYELMDRATLGAERCPCGRGLPLLSAVEGKTRPLFVLPDGRRKNSSRLSLGMRKIGGFHQFQITQHTPDRVSVKLVPNPAWSDEHVRKVHALFVEFFESPVQADLLLEDRLKLSGGGKHKELVTELV
jgi:phenylacetate-CoA ligase